MLSKRMTNKRRISELEMLILGFTNMLRTTFNHTDGQDQSTFQRKATIAQNLRTEENL